MEEVNKKSFIETSFHFSSELKFSEEVIEGANRVDELIKHANTLDSKSEEFLKEKESILKLQNNLLASLNEQYKQYKTEIVEITTKNLEDLKAKKIETLNEIEQTRLADIQKVNDESSKYSEEELNSKAVKTEITNSIKGINIVAKRARIKATNDYDYEVKQIKLKKFNLHRDYVAIKNTIRQHRATVGDVLASMYYERVASIDIVATLRNKKTWTQLMPFFMLTIVVALFFILGPITGYKGNLETIINNGIFVATVAVGAVYIYSGGSFDMSLGPASLMCATIAAMVWNATGNVFVTLLVSVLVGALLGIVNAVLANVLDLPVMVMTLTMMNILNAVHSAITKDTNGLIKVEPGLNGEPIVFATFLVTFFLLCWAIFNFTKIGRRNKLIGSNAKAAKFSGVNLMTAGIISFAISGVGLGITGFLFTSSNPIFTPDTTLATIGLNVVIAIVFGGMTTSGGPRSRVSCAIIGAFFGIFLDQIFISLGNIESIKNIANYRYLIKGAVFLIVSLINMYSSRPKMLAR